jgi:hypothetical protein
MPFMCSKQHTELFCMHVLTEHHTVNTAVAAQDDTVVMLVETHQQHVQLHVRWATTALLVQRLLL